MRFLLVTAAVLLAATPALAQGQGRGAGMLDQLMQLDTNGDGNITHAEAEAGRAAMFDRLDTDHDGYLSEAERNGAGRMGQQLASADTNSDGRVSRAEAMAAPYRAFDRLDSNNDNVISTAEIDRVRGFMGSR